MGVEVSENENAHGKSKGVVGLNRPNSFAHLDYKARADWHCHHWDHEDNAERPEVESVIGTTQIKQVEEELCKARGDQDTDYEYKFTGGEDSQANGCGTCWCCRRKKASTKELATEAASEPGLVVQSPKQLETEASEADLVVDQPQGKAGNKDKDKKAETKKKDKEADTNKK